jgi:hypothetical protein
MSDDLHFQVQVIKVCLYGLAACVIFAKFC